ncbi:MAG: fucose isomerase [Lachnospiraceae bacterium]|nr:fucose isomerase [Lachnospiraceae bacterium]
MGNVPNVKIGLIAGGRDWLPDALVIKSREKIISIFRDMYPDMEIHECPVIINDNELNVKRALKDVYKAECNALCLLYANYGPELMARQVIESFEGPVMFIGIADNESENLMANRLDTLSGYINANYGIGLYNSKAYIPMRPIGDEIHCVKQMQKFYSIARALLGINELKVMSIGPRPSNYAGTNADNALLREFGIDIVEFSELELLSSYSRHNGDARIKSIAEQMRTDLGVDDQDTLMKLDKMAQLEITISDWVRVNKGNRKYVTMAASCWPSFPSYFGISPCYVWGRMTANNIPISCEVDIYGAVSEYIGQCISGNSVTLLDINNNIPDKIYKDFIYEKDFGGHKYKIGDVFIGYHCGVTSSNMLVSAQLECHYINKNYLGTDNTYGVLFGQIVSGDVTLFRIQPSKTGGLQAYVIQGQILPVSLETYGGYGVFAVREMDRFVRNVIIEHYFPNHTVVIRGHFGSEIMSLMKMMGIKVYYNYPSNMLYESENAFEFIEEL